MSAYCFSLALPLKTEGTNGTPCKRVLQNADIINANGKTASVGCRMAYELLADIA